MDEWKQNFDPLASRVVTLAKKVGNVICQIYESGFDVFKKKTGLLSHKLIIKVILFLKWALKA